MRPSGAAGSSAPRRPSASGWASRQPKTSGGAPAQVSFPARAALPQPGKRNRPHMPRTEPPGAGGRAGDAALAEGTSPARCGLRWRGPRAGRGCPSATSGQPPLPRPRKREEGPVQGEASAAHRTGSPGHGSWGGGSGGKAALSVRAGGGAPSPSHSRQAGGLGEPGAESIPGRAVAGGEGCTEGPGPERR